MSSSSSFQGHFFIGHCIDGWVFSNNSLSRLERLLSITSIHTIISPQQVAKLKLPTSPFDPLMSILTDHVSVSGGLNSLIKVRCGMRNCTHHPGRWRRHYVFSQQQVCCKYLSLKYAHIWDSFPSDLLAESKWSMYELKVWQTALLC